MYNLFMHNDYGSGWKGLLTCKFPPPPAHAPQLHEHKTQQQEELAKRERERERERENKIRIKSFSIRYQDTTSGKQNSTTIGHQIS